MDIHFWIQMENRPWDASPTLDKDRMMGLSIQESTKFTPLPVTDPPKLGQGMRNPVRRGGAPVNALILRRYRPPLQPDGSGDAWTVPDDRKINPWDLNEPDPGENGTRGTIPGATIECDVGDTVIVHFRNRDHRADYDVFGRTHSLHSHGFVFEATSDGAFPLSPPDLTQPTGTEAALWTAIGVGQSKQGDRVPPDGTFTYTWNTASWPTTGGMWLYHDHSINDTENMDLGAVGMVLIHNKNDNQDVDVRIPGDPQGTLDPVFLPGGSSTGSPIEDRPTDLPTPIPFRAEGLAGLGTASAAPSEETRSPAPLAEDRTVPLGGGLRGELDPGLQNVARLVLKRYRTPPQKVVILQLYHEVQGVGLCINGRQYLGNTPTVLAGPDSVMRFGLVSMGSDFHTFHLHGHRWVIPGPHGTTPTEQQFSPQDTPVSQFEDTRTFGPANSFVFTIDGRAGSFMRAGGGLPLQSVGEWHMHCHVLGHMMTGMMGSLLIEVGGADAGPLPVGRPHSKPTGDANPPEPTGPDATVDIGPGFLFSPQTVAVSVGQTVSWRWKADDHSVTSDGSPPLFDSGVHDTDFTWPHRFETAGTFPYHCSKHPFMTGTVTVTAAGGMQM